VFKEKLKKYPWKLARGFVSPAFGNTGVIPVLYQMHLCFVLVWFDLLFLGAWSSGYKILF
jgi:hypothetical protein